MTQQPPRDDDPAVPDDKSTGEEGETLEWWQQPGMPFKSKPQRLDYVCLFGIMIAGAYSLSLLPFRVWLLANAPYAAIALTGSVPAIVAIGAEINLGEQWWPFALVLAALSTIKFDWLFWLGGKLWGEGVIDFLTGGASRGNGWLSRLRSRVAHWAHRLARRWSIPMMLLTYVPVLPIPNAVVYAALGLGGMRLRTFLLIDFLCALLNRSVYMYLGYRIGLPVLDVINELNKYSLWIGLAMVVVVIYVAVRNARKTAQLTGQAESEKPGAS